MAIQFRDIKVAPPPSKRKHKREARDPKYPMEGIAIGGARAFPAEPDLPKARSNIYQAARRFKQQTEGWNFKVSVTENEVLVHRLS